MSNKEILEAIDFYQDEFYGHPLTCGNDSNHAILRGEIHEGVVYLACPTCDYVQSYIPEYVTQLYEVKDRYLVWKDEHGV